MRRLAALALAALAAAGCAGGGTEDTYYAMPVPAAEPAQATLLPGTVKVERPAVSGIYSERAMVRAAADSPMRRQYGNAFWIESPARLVQAGLMASWRDRGLARHLVAPPLGRAARWRVAARLIRLDRVGPRPGAAPASGPSVEPAAVLHLQLALLEAGSGTIVVKQDYRRRVAADDASFAAYARAAGKAVQQAALAFADDVATSAGG